MNFFFFGCWNKNGCASNKHLNKIIEYIKNNKNNYLFGIILGDNIYPNANRKYLTSTLYDGMNCIKQINLPLYIVLGNHDISNCKILDIETITDKNWIFEKNFYSKEIKYNDVSIKLIIIDSNLLINPLIYKLKKCDLSDKINDNLDDMLKFIDDELSNSNTYDWIIMAAHHPLFNFGSGKNIKNNDFIKKLSNINNLIYICADLHNFQFNIIKFNHNKIYEIITGTGGGTPDLLTTIKNKRIDDITIKMVANYEPYGFVDMLVDKNMIKFAYYKITPFKKIYKFNIINQKMIIKGGNLETKMSQDLAIIYKNISQNDVISHNNINNIDYYKKYIKYKLKYLLLN